MNRNLHRTRNAFTIVELLVSHSIVAVAVTLALAGALYLLREVNLRGVQDELDVEIQTAMERLKADTRLSALEHMFFYPRGAGPFSAISFPMARDDDGDGAVDKDEDDNIVWDRTMIYHVWQGEPHQLRLTVFDPRDNTLTDTERQEQLDSVVVNGGGTSTHNGGHAATQVVFENLFDWTIVPQGARVDAYSETLTREANVSLGTCILPTGDHTFKFTVVGKNADSQGYEIGIDSMYCSPSYSRREAEGQLPATDQSGAIADYELMDGGSWNGNYQLSFPATAPGQSFTLTMSNDKWKETNFDGTGDSHDNTTVVFDTSFSPHDFVVQLDGLGTNWTAAAQTGDLGAFDAAAGQLRASACRVLLRGEDMMGGNWINYDGGKCRIAVQAAQEMPVDIVAACIGECASTTNASMDVAPGTQHDLRFGGAAAVSIPAGEMAWSDTCDLSIDKQKSYLVTLLIGSVPGRSGLRGWQDSFNPSLPSSFLIPGDEGPTAAEAAEETWSSRSNILSYAAIVGVPYLYTTLPTNGTYTSRIFDTHYANPAYNQIQCEAVVPDNTDLQLKVRTGMDPDLSDAPAWDDILFIPEFGVIDPGNMRYFQFLAQLSPDADGLVTPKLRDFTVEWFGPERAVDIVGNFTKGPDYGIFEVTVDDMDIVTGVSITMEIFKDTRTHIGTKRLTSMLSAEIQPRNNGL